LRELLRHEVAETGGDGSTSLTTSCFVVPMHRIGTPRNDIVQYRDSQCFCEETVRHEDGRRSNLVAFAGFFGTAGGTT
jgi:hypothetical protein